MSGRFYLWHKRKNLRRSWFFERHLFFKDVIHAVADSAFCRFRIFLSSGSRETIIVMVYKEFGQMTFKIKQELKIYKNKLIFIDHIYAIHILPHTWNLILMWRTHICALELSFWLGYVTLTSGSVFKFSSTSRCSSRFSVQ